MPFYPSLSLSELQLRPSTLTLFQQRGFRTVVELMESKKMGGVTTLAAELQIDSSEVIRLLQEIQDCLITTNCKNSTDITTTSNRNPLTNGEDTAAIPQGPREEDGPSSSSSLAYSTTDDERRKENLHHPNTDGPLLLMKPPPTFTARDILMKASKEQGGGGIITFCRSIDQLFYQKSGIPIGSLTEIVGLPGVGKTQFGMQLAVNTRLPIVLGGVQGQTLYIDSEGSLAPERIKTMADALLQHCQSTITHRNNRRRKQQQHQPNQQRGAGGQSPEEEEGQEVLPIDFRTSSQILQDIHVFRVLDEATQTSTLYSLPHWIEHFSTPTTPVKLIVIDSIAFHYRCPAAMTTTNNSTSTTTPLSDVDGRNHHHRHRDSSTFYFERTKALTQLAAFLNDVAREYQVAVVCINHMTTQKKQQQPTMGGVGSSSSEEMGTTRLVPALGESWAHAVTTRLLLSSSSSSSSSCEEEDKENDDDHNKKNDPSSQQQQVRRSYSCRLVKSPCMPTGTAYYQIKTVGIRDVPTESRIHPLSSSSSSSSSVQQPQVRRDNTRNDDDDEKDGNTQSQNKKRLRID